MAGESGADLYRRDPQAYLDAFWTLEGSEPWSQDELDLVNGLAYWLGQDEVDGLPEVVAMGYLAGMLEEWRDRLAEHRFTTIWREAMEAEIAEKFGPNWDRAWWARVVNCVLSFSNDLEEFAYDSGHLNERLGFLCDAVGDKIFQGGFSEENRPHWHAHHRYGCALALYVRWLELMEELAIPEEERWTSDLYARPESDPLVDLDLPIQINGCELKREGIIGGYEIRSAGALGSGHWMRFRALGDTAEIVIVIKEGKLGTRRMEVPEPRHVDVLRHLGFTQMTWPNGKRYELRNWPGIKRVRD